MKSKKANQLDSGVRKSAPAVKRNEGKAGEIVDQEDKVIGGGFSKESDVHDALPGFLKEGVLMDKQKRKPNDPNYDPTTLYIPQKNFDEATPCMRQYWELKRDNFEKIFFFKLGKFYEIFFLDSIICQKILDLNWMGGGKKLHIGFPEQALDKYLAIMVNLGYKVAVIEQTETPRMMAVRLAAEKALQSRPKKLDKVCLREVCNMVTKGTFKSKEQTYETRYILSFKRFGNEFGIAFFDVTTLEIFIGQFTDDESMSRFRTLCSQIRPVEVIHEREFSNSDVVKMLRNSPVVPAMCAMPPNKCFSFIRTCTAIEQYFGEDARKWPEVLQTLKDEEKDLAYNAFGMAIAFLTDALIDEQTIVPAHYEIYEPEAKQGTRGLQYMVLDAQALQHLEVVEAADGQVKGSLLNYIDYCKTQFGKRQLKRWLMAPLLDVDKIESRLDAIDDLLANQHETDELRAKLSKLPDLEKLLAKIFTYSIKHKVKAIYFEDVSLIKMKEFRTLLKCFKGLNDTLGGLLRLNQQGKLRSERLKTLLTTRADDDEENETGGLMPDGVEGIIQEFDQLIVWKKVAGGANAVEIPEPQKGIDEDFDEANALVDGIKEELDDYLNTFRQRYKERRISYTHAKARYEIEIPEEHVKGNNKPKDLEFSSSKQGYQRFLTNESRALVERLEVAEDKLKDAMAPFLTAIFSKFHSKKSKWLQVLAILGELDCLASLSIVCGHSDVPQSRPVFRRDKEGEEILPGYCHLKKMVHPCVTLQGKQAFIPNDTTLDTANDQSLLLVTGPNMGGKSTLLRQTAIAVILAQIGCYVPAEYCELTPVDRIFTRIGASDRILEGKSTFYVEMEETQAVLKFGTKRSLAILDELGRGTSTFDGYSIANAVMRHMVAEINCMCLFSTHYHMLLEEFRTVPGVKNYHMAFRANEANDHVIFLYKFIEGECPMSFGLNVARMAGLPKDVLKNAKERSERFGSKLDSLMANVKKQTA